MELKVHRDVVDSLISCESNKFSGFIFGYENIVTGHWFCKTSNNDEFLKSYSQLDGLLPPGIDIFGILVDEDIIYDSFRDLCRRIDVNFLIYRKSNDLDARASIDNSAIKICILEAQLFDAEQFGIIHATSSLRIYVGDNFELTEDFTSDHFGQIQLKFSSGYMIDCSVTHPTFSDENDDIPSIGECLAGQLNLEAHVISDTSEPYDSKNKTKSKNSKKNKKTSKSTISAKKTITGHIRNDLLRSPQEEFSWGKVYHVGIQSTSPPLFVGDLSPLSSLIDIQLSLLCYTRMDSPISQVATQIREGLAKLATNAIMTIKSDYLNLPYLQAQYRHHWPQSLQSPITLLHILSTPSNNVNRSSSTKNDSNKSDGALVELVPISDHCTHGQSIRRSLHTSLGLPLDRPIFRYNCSESFSLDYDSISTSTEEITEGYSNNLNNSNSDIEFTNNTVQSNITKNKLFDNGKHLNVHVGLGQSGVRNGKIYLVQGPYAYYHYLQDGINDKGWGCAYRSLQTIVSWFVLNHYITNKVPAHSEVQKALVKIGDKSASFIGSNEWIGSTEIGFFLDAEYDITWKSIFISSGDELASKARELAVHFEEQGTPVMMGGGNLAFTILGIDWSSDSGDVKFLILDPHYCGADDLATIQTKVCMMEGYKATAVGWRSCSSFNKNSFYNFCLPQRPKNIF